jgi:hypothetical protein
MTEREACSTHGVAVPVLEEPPVTESPPESTTSVRDLYASVTELNDTVAAAAEYAAIALRPPLYSGMT